ncbi:hypothetical protein ABPG72_006572 [Tetrahymena utriculariae]
MDDEALVSMIGQQKLKGLFDFFQDLMKTKKPATREQQEVRMPLVSTVKPHDLMNNKIKQKYAIFQKLTQSQKLSQAREASKKERNSKELNYNSFVYGEISFPSFAHIFTLIKEQYGGLQNEGGIFYDLGSGVGKGVLAASLLHQFHRCTGIELLESLHNMGLQLKNSILEQSEQIVQEVIEIDKYDGFSLPEINFVKDDFLTYDWSDATLVFAASTCYEPFLMQQLFERSKLLKRGSFFITLTKKLPQSDYWQLLISVNHKMSWGETTVHIYRKSKDAMS